MQLTKERKIAYILLIINTIIWGAAPSIVKNSYEITTPFRFLFYRYFIAFIFSVPIIFYYMRKVKNSFSLFAKVGFIELIGVTLSLGLLYIGLSKTSSIESGLLVTAGPVFTIIGGIIFLHEREERHEAAGLVIALLGTILLVVIPLLISSNGRFHFSLLGNLLLLAFNLTTALYYLLAKKYYKNYPKFYLTSLSFLVGLISFFILSLVEAGSLNKLAGVVSTDLSNFSVIFASVYMGIFGSIIALTFYIIGQDKIEVSEASIFAYLQPLIFIPLGLFWLGEAVHPLQIIALIVILAGVLISSVKLKQNKG